MAAQLQADVAAAGRWQVVRRSRSVSLTSGLRHTLVYAIECRRFPDAKRRVTSVGMVFMPTAVRNSNPTKTEGFCQVFGAWGDRREGRGKGTYRNAAVVICLLQQECHYSCRNSLYILLSQFLFLLLAHLFPCRLHFCLKRIQLYAFEA
jgi:hypothetical protein